MQTGTENDRREEKKSWTCLFRLHTRRWELGCHASHVEIVEVNTDVDLAWGDVVDADSAA